MFSLVAPRKDLASHHIPHIAARTAPAPIVAPRVYYLPNPPQKRSQGDDNVGSKTIFPLSTNLFVVTMTEPTDDTEKVVLQQKLLTVDEVFVYRIPPLRSSGGHR